MKDLFVSKDVNIPSEILEALENGSLVIFAGAGVSMGEPSNLPSFDDLAKSIGEDSVQRHKHEAIDSYLGRLQGVGVDVHGLAKNILNQTESAPTKLHTALVDLFCEPQKLRIVTTNFDSHFSTVIAKKLVQPIETYFAPALPLGEEFSGLVYLHGYIHRDPKQMVLADSDFGRAYLTSGWATRFLQSMFSRYTVLFVGYSHSDPIMKYLARGLALHQQTNRFSFTVKGGEDYWKGFGITPVVYPKRRGRLSHNALNEALQRWVDLTRMGVLDHDDRIKKIVSKGPSLDIETIDYLENALNHTVWIESFCRHAKSVEWLRWVVEKEAFKRLFKLGDDSETSQKLAVWLAETYMPDHSEELFALIQKNGSLIYPLVWNELGRMLAFKELPVSPTVSRWVCILISTFTSGCRKDYLEYILNRCKNSLDYVKVALLLFEYLLQPRLELEMNFIAVLYPDSGHPQTKADIKILGDFDHLKDAWQNGLKQNLDILAEKLALTMTSCITTAHTILSTAGQIEEYYDPLSFNRAAIEPHQQDKYPDDFDVVIDAARDTLEWMLQNIPLRGHALLAGWLQSGIPLFKRLSIHGMTIAEDISADDKLQWLVSNKLLYAYGMKHETLQLMKYCYPYVSKETRQWLLGQIFSCSPSDFGIELSQETIAYERFNLLVWLSRTTPDCELVQGQLSMMKRDYPSFHQRENPDFDRYTYTPRFVGHQSPMTVDELLDNKPANIIDKLLSYQGDDLISLDRWGILSAVSEAVARNFSWTRGLIAILQRKKEWTTDLWSAVFCGINQRELSKTQWKYLLRVISTHKAPVEISDSVAELLLSSIKKEDGGLPDILLLQADIAAKTIMEACLLNDQEKVGEEENDWYGKAINHPGGRITDFWLYSLSRNRKITDTTGINKHYQELFNLILYEDGIPAQLGRVILAGNLLLLYSIDSEWTKNNILQLFDWKDARKSTQAWEGYLHTGRWNEALLDEMTPLFEKTFIKVEGNLPKLKDRFANLIAGIIVYSPVSRDLFVRQYLLSASPEVRTAFTNYLGKFFEELDEQAVSSSWSQWIERYLTQRIRGVPLSMTHEEIAATLQWLPYLAPVFEFAVNLMLKMPAPKIERNRLYWDIAQKNIAAHHPTDVAKIMLYLLPNEERPLYHIDKVSEIVRTLLKEKIDSTKLLVACNHLARLGYVGATELRQEIIKSEQIKKKKI